MTDLADKSVSTSEPTVLSRIGIVRRRILISLGAILLFAVFYEAAFRYATASCGEVDIESRPPRVYYSDDLIASFPWRYMFFGFRTQLPFGKVKLAKGTGAYVDGGKFYRRLPDGSWQDITDTLIQYQNSKH